jgi:hypothetical protein
MLAHDAAGVAQDGCRFAQIALASCLRPSPLLVRAAPRPSIASLFDELLVFDTSVRC